MNTWKPDSFTAIKINENIANSLFLVPQYQRGFVWNDRQKDQFVDTLKRGLPFGTILLYHDEKHGKYQIIDGLQRCSTICDFIQHPARFFNEGDVADEIPQKLAKLTGVANPSAIAVQLKEHLVKWVRGTFQTMAEVSDMQYIKYAYAFTSSYPSARGRELEISDVVEPTLKQFKELCEGLCKAEIPAIIVEGDDDALPEIFERINSKGRQLSKYEIYAATWQKKYLISSDTLQDLIKYNKDRYESMENEGTQIADFDALLFAKGKMLNLFEIAYAFGKKLGNDFPNLFDTNKRLEEVDSLGFSLIAACLGIKNSKSKTLQAAFEDRVGAASADRFLERIIQCVKTAEGLIGKFNKFKLNAKGEVGPLHTEFQIISLIANIFVARYVIYQTDENDLPSGYTLSLESSKPTWKAYENQLKFHAWKRYCLDILNVKWAGSGDKKLDSVIFDTDYYTQPISWDDFENSLTQWYNDTKVEKREFKRVAPPKEPEKIFFALLYLPIFSAGDQADQSRYDVEHLATKNLLKKRLETYGGDLRLPIGSIGNLCLLPQKENRTKKDKTIYGDSSFLSQSKYQLSDLEAKFTFTQKSDLEWLDDISMDKDEFAQRYMQYIDSRFLIMIRKMKLEYGKM